MSHDSKLLWRQVERKFLSPCCFEYGCQERFSEVIEFVYQVSQWQALDRIYSLDISINS